MAPSHILKLACPDRVGLVAALARLMERHGCFIESSRTFGDAGTERFFARLVFRAPDGETGLAALQRDLAETGDGLSADWSVHVQHAPMRTLILVSQSDHCANALLYGARRKELPIEVAAIASNHDTLLPGFEHWGLPWVHIPVTEETKPAAETRLFGLIRETGAELVVLARYMQVLSEAACRRLAGRCINIHHSFLPGFKGARPYHQAHARGVKVIGATAHYVTADLDEGPIITQVTEPVDHAFTPADLIESGRHLEASALLRAVKAHAEHRVFLNAGNTVVFAR